MQAIKIKWGRKLGEIQNSAKSIFRLLSITGNEVRQQWTKLLDKKIDKQKAWQVHIFRPNPQEDYGSAVQEQT